MRKLFCAAGKMAFSLLPKGKQSRVDLKKDENSRKIKKILIFKLGAIGDVLMTTPFVREVRKRFPRAQITYLTGDFCRSVLEGNPNIDRIETFDQNILYKRNLAGADKLIKRMKKEKFDLAFICDMHYMINLLVYFFKIPLRIGFDRYGEGFPNTHNVKYGKVKHQVDYYLELVYLTGAKKVNDVAKKQHELFLSKKDELFAKKLLEQNKLGPKDNIVCVAPGGAKNPGQDMPTRKWPAEKFRQLVERLIAKGSSVILVGSRDDAELINSYNFSRRALNAAGKTSIKQCAAIIKQSALLITNDAGLMNVGAATGTPVLSLFGVTDPRRKAPLPAKGIPHAYLWKRPTLKGWNDDGVFRDFNKVTDINRISVAEVLSAAQRMLDKGKK